MPHTTDTWRPQPSHCCCYYYVGIRTLKSCCDHQTSLEHLGSSNAPASAFLRLGLHVKALLGDTQRSAQLLSRRRKPSVAVGQGVITANSHRTQ